MEILSNRELAWIAKGLLLEHKGFTLDEKGQSQSGKDLWAVSVPGLEQVYPGSPSVDEIKAYLDAHPANGCDYFGGWVDASTNETYLDHTELWGQKHVAIQQAIAHHQKAIYNLKFGETFTLPDQLLPSADRGKGGLCVELLRHEKGGSDATD